MTALSQTRTRLSDLRSRMESTGTDLVVLGPSSHMAWLSGVHPHGDERPVMLLVARGYAGFLMPSLNAASARQSTELPFHMWRDDAGPEHALGALLDACGATTPGLSVVLDETMRADFALLLLDRLDSPVRRFTGDTVGALRARKDRTEYEAIKAAHLLNDLAVQTAFDALREGMTERNLVQIIQDFYGEHGATLEFCSVCFGPSGAFPHHTSGETRLERDMPVLLDTGCRLNGYPSDMTRCGYFGTPDATYTEVFTVVDQAVRAAIAAARPGALARDVDKAARDVITAAGYGDRFLHRTGHGLGIDIHEPPYITAIGNTPLVEGNVFSIEPGIYLEGRFGLRLEEIVILRSEGAEVFSDMPRDLLVRPLPD